VLYPRSLNSSSPPARDLAILILVLSLHRDHTQLQHSNRSCPYGFAVQCSAVQCSAVQCSMYISFGSTCLKVLRHTLSRQSYRRGWRNNLSLSVWWRRNLIDHWGTIYRT
jgi:hypothetical protein